MKRISLFFLLSLLTMAFFVPAAADGVVYSEMSFQYTCPDVEDASESITIIRLLTTSQKERTDGVTVPNMIAGHPVNYIAAGAFDFRNVENPDKFPDGLIIRLPDTIMMIEQNAFAPHEGRSFTVVYYDGKSVQYKTENGVVSRIENGEEHILPSSDPLPSEPSSNESSSENPSPSESETEPAILLDPDKIYETSDHFLVKQDKKGFVIVGYLGGEKEVTVPTSFWDIPVYKIAKGAFLSAPLDRLNIPHGIQVEGGAFGKYEVVLNCDTAAPITIEADEGDIGQADGEDLTSPDASYENLDDAVKEIQKQKEWEEKRPMVIWLGVMFLAVIAVAAGMFLAIRRKNRG